MLASAAVDRRQDMIEGDSQAVTRLLVAWEHGNQQAFDDLIPLVYRELRRIAARARRRERAGDSLQTTALVHEAMRRILIDRARRYRAAKRGGGGATVTLTDVADWPAVARLDVLALDEALTRLAAFDPRQSRIVELLCFGGLTVDESAEVLQISERTVHREWKVAKAWLYRAMRGDS